MIRHGDCVPPVAHRFPLLAFIAAQISHMDEIVRQSMAKWPNVPAVFGWLSLDSRGNWLLKGERISNSLLNDFIGRNYESDDNGRWYFQNGPQRVFVRLAYAPWVLRTGEQGLLFTHTGVPVTSIQEVWLDENGIVIVRTEHGPGTLDDRDADEFSARFVDSSGRRPDEDSLLAMVEDLIEGNPARLCLAYDDHTVPVHSIASIDVPRVLGFVRNPEVLEPIKPSA